MNKREGQRINTNGNEEIQDQIQAIRHLRECEWQKLVTTEGLVTPEEQISRSLIESRVKSNP
jgi:hypothetical protein